MWELSGIPCKHAISAIIHKRENVEDFVSDWYTVEVYKRSYAPFIKGITGSMLWVESCFLPPMPPNMGREKGRPVRARRNEPDEQQRKIKKKGEGRRPTTTMKRRQCTLTCANCGGEGHNRKSCGREEQRKRRHQETEQLVEMRLQLVMKLRLGRTKIVGSGVNIGSSSFKAPRLTMLPPVPVSQEPFNEVLDDEIPTQQSQNMAKSMLPGPSNWDQLHQALQIGRPTEEGRKFIHLSTLQKMAMEIRVLDFHFG
ncbi:hypothetical protein ACS0TY_028114 [Phlomoides rotata]